MPTTSELMDSIRTQIAAVIASPEDYIDYTVGDKTYRRGQYLDFLKTSLTKLADLQSQEVDLDFVQFDSDIDLSGHDSTQFTVL